MTPVTATAGYHYPFAYSRAPEPKRNHALTARTHAAAGLPADWRSRLPDPGDYYRQHIEHMGRANAAGWCACKCPVHEDTHPSASVNVVHGGWVCHGCGERGDIVDYHMRVTGLTFSAAVRDLIGEGA